MVPRAVGSGLLNPVGAGGRRPRRALAGGLLAAALLAGPAACAAGDEPVGGPASTVPAGTAAPATTPPTTSAATTTLTVPTEPGTVALVDYEIVPTTITVPVGGTVTWDNRDEVRHDLLADDGISIVTGPIEPGGRTTSPFPTAGSFAYYCDIHNTMRGTVVVG